MVKKMAKIIVVEDNDLNLKLFCDLLAVKGHEVVVVQKGAEVYDTVCAQKPDLVMMDIQLKDDISGLEATKLLKSNMETAAIPVIVITAFAMKHDEERILSSGCDMYLFKPISIDAFFEAVDHFITPAIAQ